MKNNKTCKIIFFTVQLWALLRSHTAAFFKQELKYNVNVVSDFKKEEFQLNLAGNVARSLFLGANNCS